MRAVDVWQENERSQRTNEEKGHERFGLNSKQFSAATRIGMETSFELPRYSYSSALSFAPNIRL